MFAPLETLVTVVAKVDQTARFYFVGDYVNRGAESRRTIDLLIALRDQAAARFVRGNHDDVLDLILNEKWLGGEQDAFDPIAACGWFLQHGLEDTLRSYGIDTATIDAHSGVGGRRKMGELVALVRQTVPRGHRQFIRKLPVCIDEPDLFVAHAFWPPEEPNDERHVAMRLSGDAEMAHRVIWERWKNTQVLADKPWTRPSYFGHTPVQNYPASMRAGENLPVVGPMVTLLDTAIALGEDGRLTAACVEDRRIIQVDRTCRVVHDG